MAVLLSLLLVVSTVAPAAAAPLGGNAWSGPPDDAAGDEGKENGQKAENGPGENGSNGEKNASSGGEKRSKNGEKGKNGGKDKSGGDGNDGKQDESRTVDRPGRGPGNVGGNPASGNGGEQGKNGRTRGNGNADCGPLTGSRDDSKTDAGPPGNCGKKPTFDGEAYVDTTRGAVELRLTAWELIDSANVSSKWNRGTLDEAKRAELRNRMNETFAYYVGRNRTNDSRVMKADHEVATKTGRRLPNATAHLVAANRKLAETATADAESVFDALETRNESFDESETREHIDKANAALAQAEHVRNASPKSAPAIVHYRRAWSHAQRALDVMDAATEPDVTLDRRDPRHDEPINYTVQGRVFDVRAYQLSEVTVTVDGESQTVPAEVRNVTPGTSAAFAAEIRLNNSVNDVTVVVSDSGEPLSNRSEPTEPNTATATLALDADGLPDRYERNVTSTDPLDPDSNATETSRDEGSDGVSDYGADLDGDFLSNGEEFRLGTDPLANDTDGDRLYDDFEVLVVGTNPLADDTDGNGTTDDIEDADGDGLTNYREQQADTDPTYNDTDGDGIADPDELANGTDPSNPDTDSDGLTDLEEPRRPFETDPLDPDTDDDGVRDGAETYTTSTSNESVGATVSVTDEGNAAADVTVAAESEAGFDNPTLTDASKSAVTSVRSERDLTRATVELSYDESAVGDESDLAAFVYSAEEQRFVELPSTVNEDENTVTADTDRDGTFVVMSATEWSSNFRENVSEYSVEKDTFDDPGAKCDGICKSDGETVSVGVIRGGTTASTRTTVGTQSLDSARPKETDRTRQKETGSVTVNGTTYRNGPASYSTGRKSDTLDVATADSQRDSDWSGMTFATRSLSNAADIDFYGDLSGYAKPNSTARVVVVDDGRKDVIYQFSAGDSKRSITHKSIHEDLSEYAGETVKFRLEIKGSGGLAIHGWQIVEDTDGDGVPDEADLCTSTAGYQDNGCPPSSLSVLDLEFDHDVEKIRIEADVSSVVETSGSKVVFEREGPPKDDFGRNPTNLQTLYEHDATGRNSDSITDVARDLEAGETVTLRIRAEGTALIELDSIDVKIDRDGDGLWDRVERQCIETQRFGCVDTNISDPDTDGDGVPDGREVGDQHVEFYGGEPNVYFRLNSHPNETDTDDDGLDDGTESDTWNVDVVRDGSGDPYEYDAEDETGEEMEVTSSPLWKDTDGDGATDGVEKRELKTDPEEEITYGITEVHQEEIVNRLSELYGSSTFYRESIKSLGILEGRSAENIHTLELNDANDDFDFVRADDGDIVFTALDGTKRTDTWLSNREEVERGLSVWDPDTDDDGLTDGQEAKWLTGTTSDYDALGWVTKSSSNEDCGIVSRDCNFPTDPDDPDSDGDGYWDGWTGVYGVGNSSNVVLYREHLHDDDDGDGETRDDGVEGGESVPEQAGVHEVGAAPSAMGVAIYDNSTEYHSNIHVGELEWGTDPDDRHNAPDPSLSVEIDFYDGAAHGKLDRASWESGIEDNYALYGIDVNVVRDETLSVDDFVPCIGTLSPPSCVTTDTFGAVELIGIEFRHHNTPTDEYVLVAHQGGGPFIPKAEGQTGINIPGRPVQGVFTDPHEDEAKNVSSKATQNSPYDNALAFVAAKTEIHEIGHSFEIGEADDRSTLEDPKRKLTRNGEVYSGTGADRTPEELNGFDSWSIMRSGWNDQLHQEPMAGYYFAYSIEELMTVKEK